MRTNIHKDIQTVLIEGNAKLDRRLHGKVGDALDARLYSDLWCRVDVGMRPLRAMDPEFRFSMKFMMRTRRFNGIYAHRLRGERWKAPIAVTSFAEVTALWGEPKTMNRT